MSRFITSPLHLPYNPALKDRARDLRRNMTPAEQKLWKRYLRHFPFRVMRQRPIDNFIVDFYCAALKLVIEVDGTSHASPEAQARDAERTAILEGYGLSVVRFTNQQVLREFEGVCQVLQGLIPPTPFEKRGQTHPG
ncbi:MAG: endonuclease domain-containing protein [Cyanobacteria bacterium P01_F01_bin.86]